MNKNELEHKINRAISAVTPDVSKNVFADDAVSNKEIIFMQAPTKKSNAIPFIGLTAAACVMLVAGVLGYQNNFMEYSVVQIDVNPSVSLSLNKGDKVLSAEAINDDGTAILNELDLKNMELDAAVETIMQSFVDEGFVDAEKNAVLITVENNEESAASAIQKQVSSTVEDTLTKAEIAPEVLAQSTSKNQSTSVEQFAQQHGISYSKALLILQLAQVDKSLTASQMAKMTIDEIDDYYDAYFDALEEKYEDNDAIEERYEELEDWLDDLDDNDDLDDDYDDDNDDQDDDFDDAMDALDDMHDDVDDDDDDNDDYDDDNDDYDDDNDNDDDSDNDDYDDYDEDNDDDDNDDDDDGDDDDGDDD